MNFKKIHIGNLISQRVTECGIEISRICNFFKCSEKEVNEMYQKQQIETDLLLRWSKLLKYDFFRIYSQHLILYSPPSNNVMISENRKTTLPTFKKNIYTKEIIDFILEQLNSGVMKEKDIIERYRIPKTTLYKWRKKII